jgi:hypothetical protein
MIVAQHAVQKYSADRDYGGAALRAQRPDREAVQPLRPGAADRGLREAQPHVGRPPECVPGLRGPGRAGACRGD